MLQRVWQLEQQLAEEANRRATLEQRVTRLQTERTELETRVATITNLTKTLLESMGLSAANIHTINRELVYDQIAQLIIHRARMQQAAQAQAQGGQQQMQMAATAQQAGSMMQGSMIAPRAPGAVPTTQMMQQRAAAGQSGVVVQTGTC